MAINRKTKEQYPNKKGVPDREYWATRRADAAKLGVCPSHLDVPAVSGQSRCQKCIDTTETFRKHQRQNGLCNNHKYAKRVPGKTMCEECLFSKRVRLLKIGGMQELEIARAREVWQTFDGRCWGCATSAPGKKGWALDHDHNTLKFRGILCTICNLVLGQIQDNPIRLRMLITYLDRTKNL